jgi:hypothetical protein
MLARTAIQAVISGVLVFASAGADEVPAAGGVEDQAAMIQIDVVADGSDEPVGRALVFVKSEDAESSFQDEQHTNARGTARFPGVPLGRIFVQVTAPSMKTFANRYEIGHEPPPIRIKLVTEP